MNIDIEFFDLNKKYVICDITNDNITILETEAGVYIVHIFDTIKAWAKGKNALTLKFARSIATNKKFHNEIIYTISAERYGNV